MIKEYRKKDIYVDTPFGKMRADKVKFKRDLSSNVPVKRNPLGFPVAYIKEEIRCTIVGSYQNKVLIEKYDY